MDEKNKLFAPPEFWRLNSDQKSKLCNGCGTKGICGWIVPDNLLGLDISIACDIHDAMYAWGETQEDKEVADRVFFNNMLRLIDGGKGPKFLKKMRAKLAQKYYEFVRDLGGPAYWNGKNKDEEISAVI